MQEFSGRDYLKIDIANSFGLDKLLWQERLDWVHDNRKQFDLLDGDAKDPYQFRKAVRALKDVEAGRPTNHNMGLDGTNSGLQILSCLTRCVMTAKRCNVINTGKRENAYQHARLHMASILGCDPEDIDEEKNKKTVMVVFYNSDAQPKEAYGEGTEELAAFYAMLQEAFPGAYRARNLIQSFWDPHAMMMHWRLPDGGQVVVPTKVKQDRRIEIAELGGYTMKFRLTVAGAKEHGRALPANLVHSVDAYICRQMVRKCNAAGFWMAPIHDCFYASPKYMNEVRRFYVECLHEISSMPLLSDILSQISGNKFNIPFRDNGAFAEQVLHAEYALS